VVSPNLEPEIIEEVPSPNSVDPAPMALRTPTKRDKDLRSLLEKTEDLE
jgi:hypothetical protein